MRFGECEREGASISSRLYFCFVSRALKTAKWDWEGDLIQQSSPYRHRHRTLSLSFVHQRRTTPSSRIPFSSLLFSQLLLSHPPPWIPFLSILIPVSFQFDHINPTFRPSPRSMTSMASTKTQLLARWRAIEEEDDTGHGTIQPHRFQQLKEEWYVFCFSSIPSTLHFFPDSHFSEFISCYYSYFRCCLKRNVTITSIFLRHH